MRRAYVVAGLLSLMLSGALLEAGRYDGVLATDDMVVAPTAGEPLPVTLRMLVKGDASGTERLLSDLNTQNALMPQALARALSEPVWLAVEVENDAVPRDVPVLARFPLDAAPAVGQQIVASGDLVLYYVLLHQDSSAPTAMRVMLLQTQTYRQPIFF